MDNFISILYYSFSILSIFFFVSSVQFKQKKNILLVQSLASLSYFVVYLTSNAFSGAAIEIIELIKNLVFYGYEDKKKKIPMTLLIIFLGSLIVVSVITYDKLFSLLPLLINISYFISSYFKNPRYIRVVMLICGLIWAAYNFMVGAYIIIIGNILEVVSASVALNRFKDEKVKKLKAN